MVLALKDLIEKAKAREKSSEQLKASSHPQYVQRPWQQESVLFQDNKTGNEQDNIKITSREQLDNSKATQLEQTRIQQDNNLDNSILKHHLITLLGLQRKLFSYVLDIASHNDGFNTGFICTRVMAEVIRCSYDSTKITLSRLIKKGLLIRHKGKGCKGGYIVLEIPKNVKLIYCDLKQDNNRDNNK